MRLNLNFNFYHLVLSLINLIVLLGLNPIKCFNTSHFYRASYLPGQPRLEKEKLTTLNLTFAGGNTDCGYDICRNKVSLLSIFGPENIFNFSTSQDNNLLSQLSQRSLNAQERSFNIGNFTFDGHFSLTEFYATLYQNFCNGYFFELTIPFTSMYVNPLRRIYLDRKSNIDLLNDQDLSTLGSIQANARSYLRNAGLCLDSFKNNSIADCTALLGWTKNYEETIFLDYVDFTFKTGVLFPTGHEYNKNTPFNLPNGYNGHWGIPLSIDLAWGTLDWFTYGIHVDTIFLLEKEKIVPARNSYCQFGMLRNKYIQAQVDPGNVTNVSTYIQADHFIFDLSLLIGYTYSHKDKDLIKNCYNNSYFNRLINNDPIFNSWESHNLNLMIEYDLSKENQFFNPTITFFYNNLLKGKRVFKTNMIGGIFGINLAWRF